MPPIDKFKCNRCDFEMASGWGSYVYAVDSLGKRVACGHPGEERKIQAITGLSVTESEQKGLVGKNSYCVCLNCLTQLELDLARDQKVCRNCGSDQIVSELELVGRNCPKCKIGDFEEVSAGMVA